MRRALAWTGYAACAVFLWAGLLSWRSENPAVFRWSLEYLALLAIVLVLLLIPPAMALVARRLGARLVGSSVAITLLGLGLTYVVAAAHHYATRTYPFDPFLQAPPPVLDGDSERHGFRILALGGSTTRNESLPPASRYPAQLEKFVREGGRPDAVVFNAGMDWYTVKHSLIDYVTRLHEWQPDVVVVLHAINDLVRTCGSRFGIDSSSRYEASWAHFYGPAINAANPPVFARTLYDRFLREIDRKWYADWRYLEREATLEEWSSRPEFKSYLRDLVHYVRADGAQVVLVTQPSLLFGEISAEERRKLSFGEAFCAAPAGFGRYEYPSVDSFARALESYNEVVREVGREMKVPVVAAAEAIQSDLEHFTDDVHFTERGAHQLAQSVAAEIVRLAPENGAR